MRLGHCFQKCIRYTRRISSYCFLFTGLEIFRLVHLFSAPTLIPRACHKRTHITPKMFYLWRIRYLGAVVPLPGLYRYIICTKMWTGSVLTFEHPRIRTSLVWDLEVQCPSRDRHEPFSRSGWTSVSLPFLLSVSVVARTSADHRATAEISSTGTYLLLSLRVTYL